MLTLTEMASRTFQTFLRVLQQQRITQQQENQVGTSLQYIKATM